MNYTNPFEIARNLQKIYNINMATAVMIRQFITVAIQIKKKKDFVMEYLSLQCPLSEQETQYAAAIVDILIFDDETEEH